MSDSANQVSLYVTREQLNLIRNTLLFRSCYGPTAHGAEVWKPYMQDLLHQVEQTLAAAERTWP